MGKIVALVQSALASATARAQIVSAAVALTAAFGFHLPATDVAMLVSGANAILAALVHTPAAKTTVVHVK
jgi:hypothetical protein